MHRLSSKNNTPDYEDYEVTISMRYTKSLISFHFLLPNFIVYITKKPSISAWLGLFW